MASGGKGHTVTGRGPRLLVEDQPGERRLVLAEADTGEVRDLAVEMTPAGTRRPEAGDLYVGRVTRLDSGLAAAFLEIGAAHPALLPFARGATGLSEGDGLAVKVTRAPAEDKGAKVTAKLTKGELAAAAPALQPRVEPGLVRPAADALEMMLALGPEEVVIDGLSLYQALRRRQEAGELGPGINLCAYHESRPLLDREDLSDAIEERLQGEVRLPSGARLLIEPGRTLTAVDVDSARQRDDGHAARARAVNLEAASALAREARLRGLCGRIVIDFLALDEAKARKALDRALKAAFVDDPEPVRLFPMTGSGLVELTRRRRRPPLHEVLMRPVGGLGLGWVKHETALAFDALRACRRVRAAAPARPLVLTLDPAIASALVGGGAAAARAALEARWGSAIAIEVESESSGAFSVRSV